MSPLLSDTAHMPAASLQAQPLSNLMTDVDQSADMIAANDMLTTHKPHLLVRRRKRWARRVA